MHPDLSMVGGIAAVDKEIVDSWSSQGATVGWIGVDNIAVGMFSVADQLRPEAVEAVKDLKVFLSSCSRCCSHT
jgi:Cd2+/Zn2+-exporting ATPase